MQRPDRVAFGFLVLSCAGRLVALIALVPHLGGDDIGGRPVGTAAPVLAERGARTGETQDQ